MSLQLARCERLTCGWSDASRLPHAFASADEAKPGSNETTQCPTLSLTLVNNR